MTADTQAIINSMTLEQQVGQLFVLAFPGQGLKQAHEMIARYGIGGCYISQDNAETCAQARSLSQGLQQIAMQQAPKLPLLLGVDQEGAWGVLLPEATIGPGNLALGAAADTEHTRTIYSIYAREMGEAGYNTILAPCADVNLEPQNPIIGTRSFGSEPQRVAQHVQTAVAALKQNGALSAAKHFPGHGDTHSDSHRDIPVVDKPLEALYQNELLPFQAAIAAGVDLIMTSHILYPALDPQFPATLSSAILDDLLRQRMGFDGLIITDSMNMGAVRRHYTPEDAAVRALLAGADLVMLSEEHYDHSPDYWHRQQACVQAVLQAVQQGRISSQQLAAKLQRIVGLKQRLHTAHPTRHTPSYEDKREHKKAQTLAARAAIALLRNDNQAFPLVAGTAVALVNATPQAAYHNLLNARGIGPNQAEPAFGSFASAFAAGWPAVLIPYEELALQESSDPKKASKSVAPKYDFDRLAAYARIIVVTEDYPLPGEDFAKTQQLACVQALLGRAELAERLIVLALRSPYDLLEFAKVSERLCYICAYSSRTCSAQAAAAYLLETATFSQGQRATNQDQRKFYHLAGKAQDIQPNADIG